MIKKGLNQFNWNNPWKFVTESNLPYKKLINLRFY
mgnify:CR=1 FL=1